MLSYILSAQKRSSEERSRERVSESGSGQREGYRAEEDRDCWKKYISLEIVTSPQKRASYNRVHKAGEDSLKARNHTSTWDERFHPHRMNFCVGKCQGPEAKCKRWKQKGEAKWSLGSVFKVILKQEGKSVESSPTQGALVPLTLFPAKRKRLTKSTCCLVPDHLTEGKGGAKGWKTMMTMTAAVVIVF